MELDKIIHGSLRGDRISQKQLFDRFSGKMLAVCMRYARHTMEAEDLLQDGFIKVFLHLGKYKFAGELGGWIRRIMVTTALNYLKKNKRYRQEMVFAEMPLHPVSDESPSVQLDARQLSDLIRQLPTGFQTIFNLYAIEGYTHVEIGEMLGISDGTSKSQYARARYLLIEWIEKYSSLPKNEQYAGK